jgi:16S rRNA (guanine527-N7)-methyltransferase
MKAQHPSEELAALPGDIQVEAPEALQVPHLDAQRCLIWMRPRRA